MQYGTILIAEGVITAEFGSSDRLHIRCKATPIAAALRQVHVGPTWLILSMAFYLSSLSFYYSPPYRSVISVRCNNGWFINGLRAYGYVNYP